MIEIHRAQLLALRHIEALELGEHTVELVGIARSRHSREQHHLKGTENPRFGRAAGQVHALKTPDPLRGFHVLAGVLELGRRVHAHHFIIDCPHRPHGQGIAQALQGVAHALAGQRHGDSPGLHIHGKDIATAHVQGAVGPGGHDGDLARRRKGPDRFGIQSRRGVVHGDARRLHFIAVDQQAGRVLVRVHLAAVGTHGNGADGLDPLVALGLARRETDLTAVHIHPVYVLEAVGQHVGGAMVRRHRHGTGTEIAGQFAGVDHLALFEVYQLQVIRPVHDHQEVPRTGVSGRLGRLVLVGASGHGNAGQQGERSDPTGPACAATKTRSKHGQSASGVVFGKYRVQFAPVLAGGGRLAGPVRVGHHHVRHLCRPPAGIGTAV